MSNIFCSDFCIICKGCSQCCVCRASHEIEAVVLEVDKPNQRIALGLEQLGQDPWENIDQYYRVGDLVTGKVTKAGQLRCVRGIAARH